MSYQSDMSIIVNDLDSMRVRIDDLPAHPKLTEALNAVKQAKELVSQAQGDLHQVDMRRRYDV